MTSGQPERPESAAPPEVAVLRTGSEQDTAARALREVMSWFATGITVLTARGEEKAHGMTANAFTSVSLDPPLVLCCVNRTARMHDAIIDSQHFGVSVLSTEQETAARYFADKNRPAGMAQFEQVDWFPGRHTGVPLLVGSLAWLECDVTETYEGGTHSIFLGVVRSASRGGGRPLLFLGGGFHHYGMPEARSA